MYKCVFLCVRVCVEERDQIYMYLHYITYFMKTCSVICCLQLKTVKYLYIDSAMQSSQIKRITHTLHLHNVFVMDMSSCTKLTCSGRCVGKWACEERYNFMRTDLCKDMWLFSLLLRAQIYFSCRVMKLLIIWSFLTITKNVKHF